MTRTSKTVSITSGQSLSASVDLGTGVPLVLFMPAAFTGTSITFQVAYYDEANRTASTFVNLYDSAGNEVTQTVGTSRCIVLDAAYFAGMQYLKIRSGTAGVPSAEGGTRSLVLITRQEKSR